MEVEIFSSDGHLIDPLMITSESVNVSNLASGSYIMIVSSESKIMRFPFIKQ